MLNAGCSTGLCRIGVSGASSSTPRISTVQVTREDTATEMVEMISFSLVPYLVPTMSRAVMQQGIFKLVRLPVIKARYVAPVPSMGA